MKNISKYAKIFLFVIILFGIVAFSNNVFALDVSGFPTQVELNSGETKTYNIYFTNDRAVESSVSISTSSSGDGEITFSESNFNLSIGETKLVTMTISSDVSDTTQTYSEIVSILETREICLMNLAMIDGDPICVRTKWLKSTQEKIITIQLTQPENLNLIISDLDIDAQENDWNNLENGDEIDEIRPGDILDIQLEIENLFDNNYNDGDIENIETIITLKNIDDGDDIELEFNDFDLNTEDSEILEGTIKIPYEVDEGTYKMYIDIEGEDQTGKTHEIHWEIDVIVEKENEAIVISDIDLLRSTLTCDRYTSLDVEITNIGQDDLEDITIEVKNSALGISETWNLDELESGSWNDDITESHNFNLIVDDSIPSGIYTLTVSVYYDDGNELGDTKAVTLTIGNCGNDNDNETVKENEEDDYIPIIIVNPESEETYKAVSSSTKSTWPITQEPWFMPLLITLVVIIAIGVIIEVIILL